MRTYQRLLGVVGVVVLGIVVATSVGSKGGGGVGDILSDTECQLFKSFDDPPGVELWIHCDPPGYGILTPKLAELVTPKGLTAYAMGVGKKDMEKTKTCKIYPPPDMTFQSNSFMLACHSYMSVKALKEEGITIELTGQDDLGKDKKGIVGSTIWGNGGGAESAPDLSKVGAKDLLVALFAPYKGTYTLDAITTCAAPPTLAATISPSSTTSTAAPSAGKSATGTSGSKSATGVTTKTKTSTWQGISSSMSSAKKSVSSAAITPAISSTAVQQAPPTGQLDIDEYGGYYLSLFIPGTGDVSQEGVVTLSSMADNQITFALKSGSQTSGFIIGSPYTVILKDGISELTLAEEVTGGNCTTKGLKSATFKKK